MLLFYHFALFKSRKSIYAIIFSINNVIYYDYYFTEIGKDKMQFIKSIDS